MRTWVPHVPQNLGIADTKRSDSSSWCDPAASRSAAMNRVRVSAGQGFAAKSLPDFHDPKTIVNTKNLSKLYKTRANLDCEYSIKSFTDLDFAYTSYLFFFLLSKPRKVKIANGSFDIIIDYVEVRLVINYYIEIIKLFVTKLSD